MMHNYDIKFLNKKNSSIWWVILILKDARKMPF